MPKELNARQQAFVREYLKCFKASTAILRAGYKTDNPAVMGSRMLRNVNVRAALRGVNKADKSQTNREVSDWRNEVNKFAFAEIDQKLLTYDHKIKGLDMLAKVDGLYVPENANQMQAFQIIIHTGEK